MDKFVGKFNVQWSGFLSYNLTTLHQEVIPYLPSRSSVGLNPGKLHSIQCFTRIREMYFTPYTELLPSYPTVPQYS